MHQSWNSRVPAFIAGVVLALTFGCGKSDSNSGGRTADKGGSSPSSASSGSNAGAPRPGYVVGHIRGQDGKPITVPGAKIRLAIYGVSSKSGEKVDYEPAIRPDGSYEQRVVDGAYRFSPPTIDVPFNGKHFLLPLEAVGGDAQTDRESAGGIVQDFVWKTHGLRPGETADNTFTHYYGGTVTMMFAFYREDVKKSVPKPPAGTKCIFTLTPIGKLIDGSEGKPLTFAREFDPLLSGLKDSNLTDVPIGVYTLTGEEIAPVGTKHPLPIQQSFAKYGPSRTIEFAPGSSTGPWPTQISFTLGAM